MTRALLAFSVALVCACGPGAGEVTGKLRDECSAPPGGPPCACEDGLNTPSCDVAYARFVEQLDAAERDCVVRVNECTDLGSCVTEEDVSDERRDCVFDCTLTMLGCADTGDCGPDVVGGCFDDFEGCEAACPAS